MLVIFSHRLKTSVLLFGRLFFWQSWFLTWLSYLYTRRLLIWWEMVNKSFSDIVITSTITTFSRPEEKQGESSEKWIRSNRDPWIVETKIWTWLTQQMPSGKSSFFVYHISAFYFPSISSYNSVQPCWVLLLPKGHLNFILTKEFSYFQEDGGSE